MRQFEKIDASKIKIGLLKYVEMYYVKRSTNGIATTTFRLGNEKILRPIIFSEIDGKGKDLLIGNHWEVPLYPIYSELPLDKKKYIGIYQAESMEPLLSHLQMNCVNPIYLEQFVRDYMVDGKWKEIFLPKEKNAKSYLGGIITISEGREDQIIPEQLEHLLKEIDDSKTSWLNPSEKEQKELVFLKKSNPYH